MQPHNARWSLKSSFLNCPLVCTAIAVLITNLQVSQDASQVPQPTYFSSQAGTLSTHIAVDIGSPFPDFLENFQEFLGILKCSCHTGSSTSLPQTGRWTGLLMHFILQLKFCFSRNSSFHCMVACCWVMHAVFGWNETWGPWDLLSENGHNIWKSGLDIIQQYLNLLLEIKQVWIFPVDIPRPDVSDWLQSDIIQLIELASRYRGCQEPLTAGWCHYREVPTPAFLQFAKCPTSTLPTISTLYATLLHIFSGKNCCWIDAVTLSLMVLRIDWFCLMWIPTEYLHLFFGNLTW